jgi:hypothetical protein
MFLTLTALLSSPHLLYSTSITSSIIAHLIIHHVRKKGPVPLASRLTKYNSIFYSIASLMLCLAITHSLWLDISQHGVSLKPLICSHSTSDNDLTLRYIYHASKFYEYIDIFNVLAAGGAVNAHFGFHHFTVLSSPLSFSPTFQLTKYHYHRHPT